MKNDAIKHNVVDRDKILIPPNWDSHGKIRIQREGFDPERIGTLWSVEIQDGPEDWDGFRSSQVKQGEDTATNGVNDAEEDSVVEIYEKALANPAKAPGAYLTSSQRPNPNEGVTSLDMQSFLTKQLEALEDLKNKEEQHQQEYGVKFKPLGSKGQKDLFDEGGRRMAEQIGPVQFNMGGIQVDADDMVKRIKVS